jgi:hypothetical protein
MFSKEAFENGRDRARPYEDHLPDQRCHSERRAGLCAGLVWNSIHQQSSIAIPVLQSF